MPVYGDKAVLLPADAYSLHPLPVNLGQGRVDCLKPSLQAELKVVKLKIKF